MVQKDPAIQPHASSDACSSALLQGVGTLAMHKGVVHAFQVQLAMQNALTFSSMTKKA